MGPLAHCRRAPYPFISTIILSKPLKTTFRCKDQVKNKMKTHKKCEHKIRPAEGEYVFCFWTACMCVTDWLCEFQISKV